MSTTWVKKHLSVELKMHARNNKVTLLDSTLIYGLRDFAPTLKAAFMPVMRIFF